MLRLSRGLGREVPAAVEARPLADGRRRTITRVGYLLESILNPNAVIVEAPGYTGPDGRSIMPDYRDSLSTRELIDLIAYLKSLGG